MTKEDYLAIKKESRIRAVLVGILFVLGGVLLVVLMLHFLPYRRFFLVFGTAVISANYSSFVPMWQKKKAAEEQHPEWKGLGTKGVRSPGREVLKRFGVFLGALSAILISFFLVYRPAETKPAVDFELQKEITTNMSEWEERRKDDSSAETGSSSEDASVSQPAEQQEDYKEDHSNE